MSVENAVTPRDAALLTSAHPDIINAADYSYRVVAEREGYDPETIHREEVCSWITRPMRVFLEQQGYEFWPISRDLRRCRSPHMYLRSAETCRGLIVVDAAWQQFVPHRRTDLSLPKVAVGTPDEVVSLAKNAGVDDKHLDYWRRERSSRVIDEFDDRYTFGLHD